MTDGKCAIWGTPATIVSTDVGVGYDSKKAGGTYIIEIASGVQTDLNSFDDAARARLSTWILEKNQRRHLYPTITEAVLKEVKSLKPMENGEKIRRFFVFLNSINPRLDTKIINTGSDYSATFATNINEEVKLHAELISESECIAFKRRLDELSCFDKNGCLTNEGHNLLKEHKV